MSKFSFSNKFFAFENKLYRVSRRTNQSNDSNQQRVHFARQIAMNHFEIAIDVVTFVISNNQFYLNFLDFIETVFRNDEQIMFCLKVEISFTHAQKLEIARVLFSNSLHQNDQQIVKSIDETKSLMTFA